MEQVLTSTKNPLVMEARSLQQRKRREQLGLVLLEGRRLVEEALASAWEPKALFYTAKAAEGPEGAALLDRAVAAGARIYAVSDDLLRHAADTQSPQGWLLVSRRRRWTLSELPPPQRGRPWLILDGLADPGNVGTVARTAEAAGAAALILLRGSADPTSPKALRASMGSLLRLPHVDGISPRELAATLKQLDCPLWAAATRDAPSAFASDLAGPLALALGSEAAGISAELRSLCSQSVSIPSALPTESLNVAAAAAVLLFEARRQYLAAEAR